MKFLNDFGKAADFNIDKLTLVIFTVNILCDETILLELELLCNNKLLL